MKRVFLTVCLLPWATLLAQQRPLVTEFANTVARGHLRFDIAVEFLQDAKFPFSGLKGDLTRAGVFGIRIGAGENVEIQTLGTIHNILNIESRVLAPNSAQLDFSGNSTNDFGDLIMATKVRMRKESRAGPAVALRFGAELPNASNERGLGNDETNMFSSLILEKQFGKLRVLTNLGIVILGDPVVAGSQDDLFSYGFALIYPLRSGINLVADAHGRAGPSGIGNEEQTLLRLGSQIQAAGLFWDVALLVGLRDTDPSSGLILGVSKDFDFPFLSP